MKKNLFILITTLLFANSCFAQQIQWEKLYGIPGRIEVTGEILKLTDSTFLIYGVDARYTGRFFYFKMDKEGNYIWQKTGRRFLAGEHAMAPTADGGFIIAGNKRLFTQPNNTSDLYLQKTDGVGDTIWVQEYSTPIERINWPTKVLELPNRDFAVFGYATEFNRGEYALLLTDSLGNQKWYKKFKQGITAYSADMLVNFRGNFILSGIASFPPSYVWRPYLMEISPVGDSIMGKSMVIKNLNYTENIYRVYNNIIHTRDSGYVFSGYYDSLAQTNQAGFYTRGMIVKIDTAFNVQWSFFFNPPNRNALGVLITKVREQPDGTFLFMASDGDGIQSRFYLVHLNSQGQFLSYQTYSSLICSNTLRPYDFTILPDSSAIVVGVCPLSEDGYLARVKDIYSGSTVLSTPEALFSGKIALNIYPNPATDQVLITGEQNFTGTFTLYNLQGQKLWQKEVNRISEHIVPLQNLPKGVYLLRYHAEDGRQISKRIMKL